MFVEIVKCGTHAVKKVFLAIFLGIKVRPWWESL